MEVIVALGDQPERRSVIYLMNGNSSYGSRYGYVSKTSAIAHCLPLCKSCYKELKVNCKYKKKSCKRCLRLETMSNITLTSTHLPEDYSLELISNERMVPSQQISWNFFKSAIRITINNMLAGIWSETTTWSYLSSCGISNNGIIEVSSHSENMKAF